MLSSKRPSDDPPRHNTCVDSQGVSDTQLLAASHVVVDCQCQWASANTSLLVVLEC